MGEIKKLTREILSEKDNSTYELSAVLAAFTVLAFVAMSVWKMWQTKQFDPISYGTGASAIIGGGGLSRLFKGKVGDYTPLPSRPGFGPGPEEGTEGEAR